jgi:hypothetical protein
MQADPMEQWRSLTTLYGKMGDLEIRELAANLGDLTEMAQQVLRDEMKKRGMNEKPRSPVRPIVVMQNRGTTRNSIPKMQKRIRAKLPLDTHGRQFFVIANLRMKRG